MLTRKEQAEEARRKLLESAKELLFKKGYEKTSIVDITKNCGMSAGNFYHYFSSKEELILAFEREPFDMSYQKAFSDEDKKWYDRMIDYLMNITELNHKYFTPSYNGFWFAYHATHPTKLDSPENKYKILIDELSSFLERGIEAGELSKDMPVGDIAGILAIQYHGSVLYSSLTAGEYDLIGEMRKFLTSFTQNMEKYFIE